MPDRCFLGSVYQTTPDLKWAENMNSIPDSVPYPTGQSILHQYPEEHPSCLTVGVESNGKLRDQDLVKFVFSLLSKVSTRLSLSNSLLNLKKIPVLIFLICDCFIRVVAHDNYLVLLRKSLVANNLQK